MYLLLVFIISLLALLWSANHILTGASGFAARFNYATFVVGLTLIAVLTTLPEFILHAQTFFKSQDNHFIGNIIGTNIANLSLVFGVSILIKPHASNHLRKYFPIIILSMLFIYNLVLDGFLGQLDGFFFLIIGIGLIIFFIYFSNQWHKKDVLFHQLKSAMGLSQSLQSHIINITIGTLVLPISTNYLLRSALGLAHYFGMNDPTLELTISAIGITLPAILTALLALLNGKEGLGLGIILGSNALSLVLIFFFPSPIVAAKINNAVLWRDLPLMLCIGFLLSILIQQNRNTGKTIHGSILILIYFCYITSLVITPHY